ncbi:hypothetical protein CN193_18425 [Sinorhizobium meliloti]|nr:hypothetical protein CN193_18425 [Sinorhizobium meliloti]
MTIAKVHIAAAAAALMALTVPAAAQEATSKLPGGASSLQETYETWSLACQATPQTVCAISQQQVQQNGQRVLAIELKREADGALTGQSRPSLRAAARRRSDPADRYSGAAAASALLHLFARRVPRAAQFQWRSVGGTARWHGAEGPCPKH